MHFDRIRQEEIGQPRPVEFPIRYIHNLAIMYSYGLPRFDMEQSEARPEKWVVGQFCAYRE